jgi:hypothetical protein
MHFTTSARSLGKRSRILVSNEVLAFFTSSEGRVYIVDGSSMSDSTAGYLRRIGPRVSNPGFEIYQNATEVFDVSDSDTVGPDNRVKVLRNALHYVFDKNFIRSSRRIDIAL